ncbi:glycosyltransferase [Candidatus Woesearchaeota archaeon]|nr:glycosyltransferase [Candidatus Woesearchaeota archaeon]
MKINLLANCSIGAHGYGIRVHSIIKEIIKRDYDADIYCRDYIRKIKKAKYIKPILFAKYIDLFLQAILIFVSSNKTVNRLLEKFRKRFDISVSKKIKDGKIAHVWGDDIRSIKKAKSKGMVIFKESPMGNAAGLSKIFPKLKLNPHMSREEKECYKLADYIFASSQVVVDSFVAEGFPRKKIIFIPFGYDREKFFPIKNKKKKDNFRIVYAGIIRERKDVKILLEAVKKINNEKIEVVLCGIVHHGYKKIIKRYSKDINLDVRGFVPHDKLVNIYNSADIFVLPSVGDSSAKVTYEAMACGLPVIVTYNSGPVARDGKEGFIVPAKDVNKFKEKILYLYNNPKEAKKMGENAIKRVSDYTWDHYGKRIVDAYEKHAK